MANESKHLLEPANLGSLELKNRLIRSATSRALSPKLAYDATHLWEAHEDLAKGGVGAIITTFPQVDEQYWRDGNTLKGEDEIFETLTERCHAYGCPTIAQLTLVNYRKNMPADRMSAENLQEIEDMFVAAARRAARLGYDGVQIQGAHGRFLSKYITLALNNHMGGGGRATLVTNIIERIKSEVEPLHLSIKINHSDRVRGGLTEDQSFDACRQFVEAGIESIEVSGNMSLAADIRVGVNDSYYKDFALCLADLVNVPIILGGGNRSFESMERALNEGNIAFMSLGRPLIREPDLPRRWMEGDMSPATCLSCNKCRQTLWQECFYNLEDSHTSA